MNENAIIKHFELINEHFSNIYDDIEQIKILTEQLYICLKKYETA